MSKFRILVERILSDFNRQKGIQYIKDTLLQIAHEISLDEAKIDQDSLFINKAQSIYDTLCKIIQHPTRDTCKKIKNGFEIIIDGITFILTVGNDLTKLYTDRDTGNIEIAWLKDPNVLRSAEADICSDKGEFLITHEITHNLQRQHLLKNNLALPMPVDAPDSTSSEYDKQKVTYYNNDFEATAYFGGIVSILVKYIIDKVPNFSLQQIKENPAILQTLILDIFDKKPIVGMSKLLPVFEFIRSCDDETLTEICTKIYDSILKAKGE